MFNVTFVIVFEIGLPGFWFKEEMIPFLEDALRKAKPRKADVLAAEQSKKRKSRQGPKEPVIKKSRIIPDGPPKLPPRMARKVRLF